MPASMYKMITKLVFLHFVSTSQALRYNVNVSVLIARFDFRSLLHSTVQYPNSLHSNRVFLC